MARCSLLFILAIPAVLGLLVPSCTGENILYTDESLSTGQTLTYGAYTLIMQADCNLVLYDSGRAVWSTGTDGRGSNCRATMQGDGNLVLYTGNGVVVWASNTNRDQSNYVLILQKDRNVVIYGPAIWAAGSRATTLGDAVASNATASAVPVVASGDLGNRKIAMVTEN